MFFYQDLLPALIETVNMVFAATFFASVAGFLIATVLVVTCHNGLRPNKSVFKATDFIVNIIRSFPFLILMIALMPLTKLIVGKSIGTLAAIVPLSIGAAPFAARVIESAFKEVDPGVIEAAKSFGASTWQIIFKIMVKESLPSIVSGITLTLINVIGCSAMAGAIGGGGLGNIAINYGYYRFNTSIMMYTVIVLIMLVQVVQSIGALIHKSLL